MLSLPLGPASREGFCNTPSCGESERAKERTRERQSEREIVRERVIEKDRERERA